MTAFSLDSDSVAFTHHESNLASKKVCIIGAGMSGLCTCKHLLQKGLDPVVLEASSGIGGVWQKTFAITKLQTPGFAYQFSDFPWPTGTPPFPSSRLVMDYFESYARRFNVWSKIQFNCKVVSIHRLDKDMNFTGNWGNNGAPSANGRLPDDCSDGVWEVRVHRNRTVDEVEETIEEVLHFDFIIICTGRFGDVPRIPSFPPGKGAEIFKGTVLHALHYSALDKASAYELLNGKRVVVVGLQKSALDVAMEAAIANPGVGAHPCTLIYRKAHWVMPLAASSGTQLAILYFSRLMELLAVKPDQGVFLSILSKMFSPARWAVSKFVELSLLLSLPIRKYGLVPDESFYQQLSSCVVTRLPDDFFSQVETGHIRPTRSPNWSFCEKGVVLDDCTEVEADVVILATGYDGHSKLKSLMPDIYKDVLQDKNNLIPLYRGIIHPQIPDIAIVGFQEGPSNLHTSEMQARWLAYFLTDKFRLPDILTMEDHTRKWTQYFLRNSTSFFRRACIGTIQIWHTDQLCRDMGWNPRRKKTWIAELFAPYSNLDYQDDDQDRIEDELNTIKQQQSQKHLSYRLQQLIHHSLTWCKLKWTVWKQKMSKVWTPMNFSGDTLLK